jgi:hypothetical protein
LPLGTTKIHTTHEGKKKCLEENNMTNKPTFGKIAHNVYKTFTND